MEMRKITILTSGQSFTLDSDEATGLLEHIRQDAGEYRAEAESPLVQAIDSQGAMNVMWTPDGKQGALNAIVRWLIGGDPDATEVIRELQNGLMSDLSPSE